MPTSGRVPMDRERAATLGEDISSSASCVDVIVLLLVLDEDEDSTEAGSPPFMPLVSKKDDGWTSRGFLSTIGPVVIILVHKVGMDRAADGVEIVVVMRGRTS